MARHKDLNGPYDLRTRAERLYDDHAEAHEAETCFEDCLLCAEEEDMRKNAEVERLKQRIGPAWRREKDD